MAKKATRRRSAAKRARPCPPKGWKLVPSGTPCGAKAKRARRSGGGGGASAAQRAARAAFKDAARACKGQPGYTRCVGAELREMKRAGTGYEQGIAGLRRRRR